MIGMEVKYLGSLRCEGKHLKSGNTLITDAPTDNKGRGEAFSPTDLLCTSLAACMITLIGITANEKGYEIDIIEASVEKIMGTEPRRVVGINIQMNVKGTNLDEKAQNILTNAAHTCPVAKSLNSEIKQELEIRFS
jgi:putative redox protein